MSVPAAALAVDRLDLRIGRQVLLGQLSLSVRSGERWALLGRNGAGKSTLLRHMAGLGGEHLSVALLGRALAAHSPGELARGRAFLPSQPRDRFGIAVLHAVMLAQPSADEPAALGWLQRVDAGHLAHRHVLELSAGERQRVALAQVLAQRAPVLLLDEPVSFQDPAHQGLVARLLVELATHAIVFAAHDVNWVAHLATHVLGLAPHGQWVAGPVGEVLNAQNLERVYQCGWTRVERADGPPFWLPL